MKGITDCKKIWDKKITIKKIEEKEPELKRHNIVIDIAFKLLTGKEEAARDFHR